MQTHLFIHCPEMPVTKTALGWRTGILKASGYVDLPDGKTWNFPFTFPSVPVTKNHWWDPLHWTVAQCPAFSPTMPGGPSLSLLLPPEPCDIQLSWPVYMIARRIVALGELVLPNGQIGKASIVFPDADSYPQGNQTWLVDPVDTEDGVVTW